MDDLFWNKMLGQLINLNTSPLDFIVGGKTFESLCQLKKHDQYSGFSFAWNENCTLYNFDRSISRQKQELLFYSNGSASIFEQIHFEWIFETDCSRIEWVKKNKKCHQIEARNPHYLDRQK